MLTPALNTLHPPARRLGWSRRLVLWPLLLGLCLLCMACTPSHDWREVQGEDGSYLAWMPAKSMTQSRPVTLADKEVAMTMTAARVDHVTYAISSARLPDPTQASAVLQQLKTALVSNINGHIVQETALQPGPNGSRMTLEATGAMPGVKKGKVPLVLVAHLIAHQKHIYQLVVVGPETEIEREQIATFLTGFRLR